MVGVDADFRKIRTVRGLQTTLRGYPPGTTLEARVTSANTRGEAPPSTLVRWVAGAGELGGGRILD